MKKVILHFETLTPMFLGGADMKKPEIRTASIKGMLRFWWRAMNAHLVEKKNGKWDYSQLKEYENAIFGGTDSPKAQKSKVLLRIVNMNLSERQNFKEIEKQSTEKNETQNVNIIRHLNRNFLEGSWDLQCEYPEKPISAKIKNDETEINVEKELQIAFSMLNLFGTLGSKARNGFGSIQINSENFTLLNIDEIQKHLQEKIQSAKIKPPDSITGIVPYTAFTTLHIVQQGEVKTAIEGLEEIAQNYRSAKKRVKPYNQMIAAPQIPQIKAERYPKRYWFSVKRTENGKLKWQCLYLPVCIEFKDDKGNYVQKYKTKK